MDNGYDYPSPNYDTFVRLKTLRGQKRGGHTPRTSLVFFGSCILHSHNHSYKKHPPFKISAYAQVSTNPLTNYLDNIDHGSENSQEHNYLIYCIALCLMDGRLQIKAQSW